MTTLEAAIQARQDQDFEQAKRIFAELYQANPDSAVVNYHFAWLHDLMGDERGAVPYYEAAIRLGLADEDLQGAMLGLGSTYRTIGNYQKAAELLYTGMVRFPDAAEFPIFLAMAKYNLGEYAAAMGLLLKLVATHPQAEKYARAIGFYADKLDQTW